MHQWIKHLLAMMLLLFYLPAAGWGALLYVSEIMADNDGVLLDADGDESDWIELYNDSTNEVSLSGWYLTDSETNLTRWAFPDCSIPAKGFLIVFASDKDRAVSGSELHTNFKLSADGEYIALVRPDGTTLEDAYSFPAQLEDVSWGHGFVNDSTTTTATLVEAGAACTAHVPASSSDAAGWQQAAFNDSSWSSGTTGVGYEKSSGFEPYIGLDVKSLMYGRNASVYIRVPFVYSGDPLDVLWLRMRYDDGFVAYLNGTRISMANAPDSPTWNSRADASNADSSATVFQRFDVSSYAGALLSGTNVLALQGLNYTSSSSDALFTPELAGAAIDSVPAEIEAAVVGTLRTPTPGSPNTAVGYTGYCETPAVYPERGIYETPFTVTISNAMEGAEIRYTLDGSTPTAANSVLYTGPVTISGTTLLRASAFKGTFKPSTPNTQTYLFVADVLKQDGSGLQPYASWGDGRNDWAVDPTMTNAVITVFSGDTTTLPEALLDLPTVSLVTDWDNWWSDAPGPALADGVIPWQGIYADIIGESAVRRPVSMEFFTPDGSDVFSSDGQVSIVGGGIGGTSANRWKTDKLSMRVVFDKKLDYPVYGDEGASKFNGLVLDAHLAWTWTHSGSASQRSAPKYMVEAVTSDLRNSMGEGKGAPHSRFVHLYLNGLYWGMYEMHERPDEHFAAEYYGGSNEDYDSIKHWADDDESDDSDHDGDPYNDNITNGDDADYNAMLDLSRNDLSLPSNYAALADVLDIRDLIDYLLMNFFVGNTDWAHKNWYATRNQTASDGVWRYHAWDTEHIMEVNLWDPTVSEALYIDVTEKDNEGGPTEVHQNLCANDGYRLRFADQVHRHLFNDGILTTDAFTATFWGRLEEVEKAMLGEAARWADNIEEYDYDDWRNHIQDLLDIYIPYRRDVVLSQLKARGLYPDTAAPEFEVNGARQHGGRVAAADAITIDSAHEIYYTTDGSDPQSLGGTAALYHSALSFSQPTQLKARAKNGTEWSALCEAVFWTEEIPLAVTELMYHAAGSNQQEFIEIRNMAGESIPLHGYTLDGAIDFAFSNSVYTSLAPGEFLVVIKDLDGFSDLYATNGIKIAGEYRGDFDNSGEKVDLEFFNRDLISFRYSDARNWPQAADGAGHSLVPLDSAVDDEADGSLSYGGNWRASSWFGGSPGYADPVPEATVVLNEISAHTDTFEDPPFETNDRIELYNPTAFDITLNGWYMSDDLDDVQKWAVPEGTVVPARGFVLFDEDDFHPDRIAGFGLDKAGEEVVLAAPGRIADAIRYKGQLNGISLGRYPDGTGTWLMTEPTPEAPNRVFEETLWISELMYNPPAPDGYADGDSLEYIRVENRAGYEILFGSEAGSVRIDGGVSYSFSSDFSLPAGETLWLVSFNPADSTLLELFCETYGLNAAEEIILGPYRGHLSNEGERVAVEWPQASDDPDKPLDISWAVLDELYYFHRSPWPAEADGTGHPLVRTGVSSWGVATASDTDADALDDAWEVAYFSHLGQGANDDPDNDQFSNLQEQIAETNPTNGLSYFAIDGMQAPSITWTAVPGRSYCVYWTDDLSRPFTPVAWGIKYPQGSYTDESHRTRASNFYYITVEMQ